MSIWIATEFYSPYTENAIGYFVRGIAEKLAGKKEVHVVFPCTKKELGREDHVMIHPVTANNFARKSLILRMIGQFIMSLQFFFLLIRKTQRDDMVICFTQPVFFMLLCVLFKKIKRNKIVIINYDLFPEVLIGTGVMKPSVFYQILLYPFNRAYECFDIIISIGSDMTAVLKEKVRCATKIITIPCWTDTEMVFFQEKKGNDIIIKNQLTDKLVFSFAGNMGRCQGLNKLLCLIDQINPELNVHFLFLGKGVLLDSFLSLREQNRNIDLITYLGYYQGDKNVMLNACDIAIVSCLEEMKGFAVPSKTYDILASGHPILFFGAIDSEIGKLITEHQIGWVCGFTDIDSFKGIIEEILNHPALIIEKGLKARSIAELLYEEELILEKYIEALVY